MLSFVLTWCELINPSNFFIVNVFYHTSGKTSRVSWASGSRLASRILNVSSRSRLEQNFERLGLGDMGLGSRLGLGSEDLVHIPGKVCTNLSRLDYEARNDSIYDTKRKDPLPRLLLRPRTRWRESSRPPLRNFRHFRHTVAPHGRI